MRAVTRLNLATSRGSTEGHLGHLDTSKLAALGNTQMIGFFFKLLSLCSLLSDSSTQPNLTHSYRYVKMQSLPQALSLIKEEGFFPPTAVAASL